MKTRRLIGAEPRKKRTRPTLPVKVVGHQMRPGRSQERPGGDQRWRDAHWDLVVCGDAAPLSRLIGGDDPIPPWLREELARWMSPPPPRSSGRKVDPGDRLVFTRSAAFAGKMQTHQQHLAAGVMVIDRKAQDASRSVEDIVSDVAAELGVDEGYVWGGVKYARYLPPAQREFARSNPPVWGTRRTV